VLLLKSIYNRLIFSFTFYLVFHGEIHIDIDTIRVCNTRFVAAKLVAMKFWMWMANTALPTGLRAGLPDKMESQTLCGLACNAD
jgi:hypothetical protein